MVSPRIDADPWRMWNQTVPLINLAVLEIWVWVPISKFGASSREAQKSFWCPFMQFVCWCSALSWAKGLGYHCQSHARLCSCVDYSWNSYMTSYLSAFHLEAVEVMAFLLTQINVLHSLFYSCWQKLYATTNLFKVNGSQRCSVDYFSLRGC